MNVFLGHYEEALDAMLDTVGVELVIAEQHKFDGSAIAERVREHELQCAFVTNVKEIENVIAKTGPFKIGLVASFGMLLSDAVLAKFDKVINVHPGDVHRYRGRHPLPVAILNGEPYCSLSVHLINDEKIDRGPLLAQLFVAIDYSTNYQQNEKRLRAHLYPLLSVLLSQWKYQEKLPMWDWQPQAGSYRKALSKDVLEDLMSCSSLEKYQGV